MTAKPSMVSRARGFIAAARSFHLNRLTTYRKVIRIGKSRVVVTKGQAITTSGAVFAAGSVSSAGAPDWTFWIVLLGGILGGKFVFPMPVSSIASKKGPADVEHQSTVEMDSMTPTQIRSYENNMILKHRLKSSEGLGTAQALWRQQEATRSAKQVAALKPRSLKDFSVADIRIFTVTSQRHEQLKDRWLSYEVDPHLRFDFPAMSDARIPATASMIRAMHAADRAKTEAQPIEYQLAVAGFADAMSAAESHAGVRNN